MASAAQLAQVESEVASLATQVDLLGGRLETEERTMQSLLVDLDMLWVLLGSILVFFMQVGAALDSLDDPPGKSMGTHQAQAGSYLGKVGCSCECCCKENSRGETVVESMMQIRFPAGDWVVGVLPAFFGIWRVLFVGLGAGKRNGTVPEAAEWSCFSVFVSGVVGRKDIARL